MAACVRLAACIAFTVCGCASTVRFVVVADVPPTPTFTVIPASTAPGDDAAADSLLVQLVELGVHVVERPALVKQRTEYSGTSSGAGVGVTLDGKLAVGGVGGAQAGGVTTSIDPIALLQETQADYVVFAKRGPWLKIVKRSDGQIVYVGDLAVKPSSGCCLSPAFWTPGPTEREHLKALLNKMGAATE